MLLPVLVEAATAVLAQVLGEDGLEGAQTLGRLDVADDADDDHWWRLDDGDRLDGLLLVELGAEFVDITHDVCHAGLVADEGRQVHGLGGVVLGEGFALASMAARALLGQEAKRAMSRMLELTVTLHSTTRYKHID